MWWHIVILKCNFIAHLYKSIGFGTLLYSNSHSYRLHVLHTNPSGRLYILLHVLPLSFQILILKDTIEILKRRKTQQKVTSDVTT